MTFAHLMIILYKCALSRCLELQPTVVHMQWQVWDARTQLKIRICSGANFADEIVNDEYTSNTCFFVLTRKYLNVVNEDSIGF